jgi:formylglycine-generating enzyme required for sulfatase activity
MSRLLRLLPAVLALAVTLPLVGQAGKARPGKFAVLVGINQYDHRKLGRLKYAENDVKGLGRLLAGAGYEVLLLTPAEGAKDAKRKPTKANIEARLKEVLRKCGRGDTALVALAGHGLHFEGQDDSFFCPVEGLPFKDETATLVSLKGIYAEMDKSRAGVRLLLVDACRNDPAAGRGSRGADGDTAPRPPTGVGALFSCSKGQVSWEHADLKHGVFFHYVLEGLRGKAKDADGEVTFLSLATYVDKQVSKYVPNRIGDGARQTPSLNVRELSGAAVLLTVKAGDEEPPPRVVKKEDDETKLEAAKSFTNSVGMKLVLIPKGKFKMGSPEDEKDRSTDEKQHDVEITRPFCLGIYTVTQKQYKEVMGENPSWFSAMGAGKDDVKGLDTDDFPVETVSWHDAKRFCEKLSDLPAEKRRGRTYRLPTEAEWEYACRGGAHSSNPFHFGKSLSSRQANFDGNHPYGGADKGPYLERTCKVGSYDPNKFGLHDMHGNVWQWCADWYAKDYYEKSPKKDPKGPASGTVRVVRGGSWRGVGWLCRAAFRLHVVPDGRCIGFRVACDSLGKDD